QSIPELCAKVAWSRKTLRVDRAYPEHRSISSVVRDVSNTIHEVLQNSSPAVLAYQGACPRLLPFSSFSISRAQVSWIPRRYFLLRSSRLLYSGCTRSCLA